MGRKKTVERVKKEALDNIVDLMERQIRSINKSIWSNKYKINDLVENTRVLKKERLKLTQMLKDLKSKE